MKIIHKTVLRELTYMFFLSLVAINFTLLMESVLRLSRVLTGVGASIFDMAKIILYIQPQIMLLTMPVSLLLSTLVTYGRLNADNELTALKSAGMTFMDICRPVFILGTGCFLAGLLVSFYMGPFSAGRLRESISNIIMERAPKAVEAGIFNTFFKDIVILVREKQEPDIMKGIFIYDNRNRKEPKVMVAKEGRVYANNYNLSLYLRDGHIHIAKPGGSIEVFFSGYNIVLNLALSSQTRRENEMTPGELLREAKTKETKEKTSLFLEFHRRLSLPLLSIFLIFLGPPLALLSGRSGKLNGLTIGLGVFAAFYMMLIYSENMSKSGTIPHYAGAWLPIAVIALVSAWAFKKVLTK